MTEEQRTCDTIEVGERVRARIRKLVEELDSLPSEEGPITPALITWRIALLTLAWDVSEGPLTLATANSDQVRAMRILNRTLFEYAIHPGGLGYNLSVAMQLSQWRRALENWFAALRTRGSVFGADSTGGVFHF
jgi:hypothetical protein